MKEADPRAWQRALRGRVLIEMDEAAEARLAFVRARDEDVCPLRAFEAIQEIVRDVARESKVPLIDFAALVDRESADGIPGADWFLDHVHPTIEGYQRLARELANELIGMKVVSPQPSWTADGFQRAAQHVVDQIDPRDHALALRNLGKVLSWAGKVDEYLAAEKLQWPIAFSARAWADDIAAALADRLVTIAEATLAQAEATLAQVELGLDQAVPCGLIINGAWAQRSIPPKPTRSAPSR